MIGLFEERKNSFMMRTFFDYLHRSNLLAKRNFTFGAISLQFFKQSDIQSDFDEADPGRANVPSRSPPQIFTMDLLSTNKSS